ncbi:MAG: biopolymer transporter ExbD [bacterium]
MNFRRQLRAPDAPLMQTAPLLSVVLLLLCLFVGGSAFVPAVHEPGFELSDGTNGQLVEQRPEAMVVEISPAGELSVSRQALTLDELRVRLRQLSREMPDPVVRVRADPGALVLHVLGVLEACRSAAITCYTLAGDEP